MLYGLIVVTPKLSKKRLIIHTIVITLILLIASIIVFGVWLLFKENHVNVEILNIAVSNLKEIRIEEKKETKPKYAVNEEPLNEKQIAAVNGIYHGNGKEKVAYLTFDDGPTKNITPLILDTLDEYNIKATFFVLGNRVDAAPEIVKQEYERGHYIANHGYSHKYSKIYESKETVLEEYNQTEEAIQRALGSNLYHSRIFRFPGGSVGGYYKDIKKEAVSFLEENGIAHIDWNALTGDAEGKHDKEALLDYAKQTIGEKSNVVILMHDASDKILTYEVLPDLINYLKEQGFIFKNFYDVLGIK